MIREFILILGLLATGSAYSQSTCLSQIRGPITFDVKTCQQLELKSLRFSKDSRIEALKGMDRRLKSKLLSKYKGQMIEGKVVSSEAFDKQFPKEKGVLNGQKIKIYIYPDQKMSCESMEFMRIEGQMEQICCNGRLDAPCLLDTQYTFKSSKVVGKTKSRAGNAERVKSLKSKAYLSAAKAFQKKRYARAAKLFEKARAEGALDDAGKYALGVSYRQLDQCPKAIPVLRELYDDFLAKKNWADKDTVTRKAIFLLARCYSKELNSGQAVLILNGYLIEPKKYRKEIKQSLRHADFGWIHTTKDYLLYKKDVRKKTGLR